MMLVVWTLFLLSLTSLDKTSTSVKTHLIDLGGFFMKIITCKFSLFIISIISGVCGPNAAVELVQGGRDLPHPRRGGGQMLHQGQERVLQLGNAPVPVGEM